MTVPTTGQIWPRARNSPAVTSGGTTILSGTATPTEAVGALGDYYLDTDDRILYGPKAGGYGAPATAWTTPTVGNVSAWTGSMGQDFTFSTAVRITALRYHRGSTVGAEITSTVLRVWSSTGVELGQASTSGETVGFGWWTATLATPVGIAAGQKVRISFDFPESRVRASASAPTVPFTNGPVTVGNSWYIFGTVGYPTTDNGTPGILTDALFQTVVEPWPVALRSVPPGGTTGQSLKKTSNTDYAVAWVT